MRLYLDQMFREDLATILAAEGHDVLRAEQVGQARAEDDVILAYALEDHRILITHDQHFGDWAVLPLGEHEGVIRVRVNPTTTKNAVRILLPLLASRKQEDFKNHLVIASLTRTRWINTAKHRPGQ